MQDEDDQEDPGVTVASPYGSPVLKHLDEKLHEPVPPDDVACRDCPSSLWYWNGPDALSCFCAAMHKPTWGGSTPPVRLCDGRTQAIARLIAQMAAQRP